MVSICLWLDWARSYRLRLKNRRIVFNVSPKLERLERWGRQCVVAEIFWRWISQNSFDSFDLGRINRYNYIARKSLCQYMLPKILQFRRRKFEAKWTEEIQGKRDLDSDFVSRRILQSAFLIYQVWETVFARHWYFYSSSTSFLEAAPTLETT